jgi:hypothetical protein
VQIVESGRCAFLIGIQKGYSPSVAPFVALCRSSEVPERQAQMDHLQECK